MQHKKLVPCASAAILAFALACSNDSQTPTSPTSAAPGTSGAAADGSTLKATAPAPQSPVNNQQPDLMLLVAGKSAPAFPNGAVPDYAYEFEVRNSGGTAAVCPAVTVPGGGGPTVSASPTCTLEFDQPYSWRVRAVFAGSVGPWSANSTFRAPAGGYVRGNEIFDPLTNGRSAGELSGPVQFIPGQGARMVDPSAHITYRLQDNLQQGEMSMMVLDADEGNPGDKAKIFSMQEGPNIDDITTDDYRMTAELRGQDYGAPGAVTYRIIPGDGEPRDGHRVQHSFSRGTWYFWRFTWQTGSARLEVREGGPNGRALYDTAIGTGDHPYRPVPHVVHIGSPSGRAGLIDATHTNMIAKNFWVSSRPRPAFPGE